jgi:mitogen-activated protein kinase 7
MLARRHLFPGRNYLNQLQLILSVVGTPSEEYIQNVGTDRVKTYLQNLPPRKPVELSVLFPEANQSALDFLSQMLLLDPKKRLSATDALAHPYLSRYHDPKEEPVCSPPFDFSFERDLLTKDDLRKAIFEEIDTYHKCKLPIPSHDIVKDALIKMMKDRDQERAAHGEERGTSQAPAKENEGKPEREGTVCVHTAASRIACRVVVCMMH